MPTTVLSTLPHGDGHARRLPYPDPVPALPESAEESRADSARRVRLERVFSDFYDSLFNAAFDGGDCRPQRCLDALHHVKAHQAEIIAGTLEDIALQLAEALPDAAPMPAHPDPGHLQEVFARRCRILSLEPQERVLLESAFQQQLLEEQAQQPVRPGAGTRELAQPGADTRELHPPRTADGDNKLARIVARFRSAGLKLLLPEVAPPDDAESASGVPAPETRRGLRNLRIAGVASIAVAMLGLGLRWGDPEMPVAPRQQEAEARYPPGALPADELLVPQVHYLLRRGDAALAALRLTDPFPDSASANYLAVLAIDPRNASARRGLEGIVVRYVELAQGELQRGDIAQAKSMLERARTVLPQATALRQLEHDIAAACTMRVPPCTPNLL